MTIDQALNIQGNVFLVLEDRTATVEAVRRLWEAWCEHGLEDDQRTLELAEAIGEHA